MTAAAEKVAEPGRPVLPNAADARLKALCEAGAQGVFARANRLFAALLPLQWAAAVVLALGRTGVFSVRSGVAGLLGGLCCVPALLLIRARPRAWSTRAVVALSQAGFSLLLVHLADGRFQTGFYLFGSLAVVALFREWTLLLLMLATGLVHAAGAGWAWPAPGQVGHEDWPETLAYAGWLAIETVALAWACVMSRREMRGIAAAQAQNEQLLAELEQRVRDRTRALQAEVTAHEEAAAALRQSEQQHRDLVARLPIGVFETTRSGRINFANAHLLSMVGLPGHIDARAISLADGRIFPVAERERLWDRLENRREVHGFATVLRHFDGSPFDVVVNARVKTVPGEEPAAEGTVEDVTVRKRAERELETLHSQLVLASRQAGMAEVATGVLHNVGNVLTSVNLVVHDVQDRLKSSRLAHLQKVVEILERERPRLGEFLATDPTGRQIPDFLTKLNQFLVQENQQLLSDVDGLVRHVEHIREIIVTQQGSANLYGVLEVLSPTQLIDDALRLNEGSRTRHQIAVERIVQTDAQIKADRHKVLQILVNLLKNAKDALLVKKPGERMLRVTIAAADSDRVAITVEDNGAGIEAANLTRIFQHGYTTKQTGHGFGLHSSALAAADMKGELLAASAGPGQGARFTLALPAAHPPAA